MKLIRRDKSVVTGKKNLEHLVTYKNYPVFIGATKQPEKRDVRADMSFSICKDSGIIQLDKLVPLDVLYSEYHSEAIGSVWAEHHKKFIEFFSKFKPKNVLEIGGSNCFMAEQYVGNKKGVYWTNVEPNPVPSKNPRIKVISKLFDEHFKMKGKVDAIIHSHLIEHMYDPGAFLKNVGSLIDDGTLQMFSVPNLRKYLELGYSNCVNFEHTIFLTEYFVDYFLAKNGFAIIKKQYFQNHSIFYATRKTSKKTAPKLVSHYKEYKREFSTYVKNNKKIVADINRTMRKAPGKVYLFGAHAFSQTLINLGLNAQKITSILDNSKIKQGERLYGSDLIVAAPQLLKDEPHPTVILRVGAYKKEIEKQLRNMNDGVRFID